MLTSTNPSLMIVRDWILKGRISGEWAVQTVASLPASVATPTKELLSSWMVQRNQVMYLGRILRLFKL